MPPEPPTDRLRVPPRTACVLGTTGPVASRLAARLAADPTAAPRTISPAASDLIADLTGTDVLFVMGPSEGSDLAGTGGSSIDLAGVDRVLDAASTAAVPSIVALSTAMVYGAWDNNPVPLTEDAPMRPHPTAELAVASAELERRLAEWADDNPTSRVAILRPVVTVSAEQADWFRRSPWVRSGVRVVENDPPRQFLHVDDLLSALLVAWERRLAGPFNVAPDGWLSADSFHDLEGPSPRISLGPALASKMAGWRFRAGLTTVPPSVLAYTTQPWVVANDRLRAEGWRPAHTNEEAMVEADRAGPLRSMSPRVRQELSLAAVGLLVAGLVTAVVLILRRGRRSG